MRWMMATRKLAGLALLGTGVVTGAACAPSNTVEPGAPRLLSFTATAPDGTALDLTDPQATSTVSPLEHFQALFDRLLDPTQLSALDGDGGILPEQDVAEITSTPAVDPLTVQATYTPNGFVAPLDPDAGTPLYVSALGPGPSITIVPTAALPCGAMVSVALNPAKVRSHDQKATFVPKDVTVPVMLTFTTAGFGFTFNLPQPPPMDGGGVDASDDAAGDDGGTPPNVRVAADSTASVKFNTLVGSDAGDHITVTVTVGSAVVPGFGPAVVDASDPSLWNVAPPSAGWPAGATVTITVDGDVVDGYGSKPAQVSKSASFEVAL